MKVVLFCGGQGLRIREYAGMVPKPMVHVGYRPILWHVMKYYAHFGHTDFILCLGHHGEVIRNYFRDHDRYLSYDFVPRPEDERPQPVAAEAEDWSVTLADTGEEACIGERLQAVQPLLAGEEAFLANYADCVTDFPLPAMTRDLLRRGATAGFLSVEPFHSFHVVEARGDGTVEALTDTTDTDLRINGGYFMLTQDIFDYMEPGDELVEQPFQRLIREQRLLAYAHDGFWGCMDTPKEKKLLEDMHRQGAAPWELWKQDGSFQDGLQEDGDGLRDADRGVRQWGRQTFDDHWGEQPGETPGGHPSSESRDQP